MAPIGRGRCAAWRLGAWGSNSGELGERGRAWFERLGRMAGSGGIRRVGSAPDGGGLMGPRTRGSGRRRRGPGRGARSPGRGGCRRGGRAPPWRRGEAACGGQGDGPGAVEDEAAPGALGAGPFQEDGALLGAVRLPADEPGPLHALHGVSASAAQDPVPRRRAREGSGIGLRPMRPSALLFCVGSIIVEWACMIICSSSHMLICVSVQGFICI